MMHKDKFYSYISDIPEHTGFVCDNPICIIYNIVKYYTYNWLEARPTCESCKSDPLLLTSNELRTYPKDTYYKYK